MCGLMEDDYDLDEEKLAVSDLLARREVPSKDDDNLLIETWNIENLGSKGSRKRSRFFRRRHVLKRWPQVIRGGHM